LLTASLAGLRFFAVIFALAFALGVARALIIAPRLGETTAVLIEVPLLVAASWIVTRHMLSLRAFDLAQRYTTGTTAFLLTMASEAGLAQLLRGQDTAAWAKALATPLGLVGLAGQLAFAAMPVLTGIQRSSAKG
jgi:hypothetical protein